MRYQLAIFDMDGTILNTLQDLTNSLNAALQLSGYPQHTLEEVAQIDKVHQDFTEHYRVHCADTTQPYAGIPELLQQLRNAGCKTAVVSNKADYAVQELCKQYFDGMFDFAVGERKNILKKPAPDAVNEVLQQLQTDRSQAVYIGDSDVDVETAKNAKMDGIFVDWGFRSRDFLLEHGAKTIVSQPEELAEQILG